MIYALRSSQLLCKISLEENLYPFMGIQYARKIETIPEILKIVG